MTNMRVLVLWIQIYNVLFIRFIKFSYIIKLRSGYSDIRWQRHESTREDYCRTQLKLRTSTTNDSLVFHNRYYLFPMRDARKSQSHMPMHVNSQARNIVSTKNRHFVWTSSPRHVRRPSWKRSSIWSENIA